VPGPGVPPSLFWLCGSKEVDEGKTILNKKVIFINMNAMKLFDQTHLNVAGLITNSGTVNAVFTLVLNSGQEVPFADLCGVWFCALRRWNCGYVSWSGKAGFFWRDSKKTPMKADEISFSLNPVFTHFNCLSTLKIDVELIEAFQVMEMDLD